jgi:hypothetical protein
VIATLRLPGAMPSPSGEGRRMLAGASSTGFTRDHALDLDPPRNYQSLSTSTLYFQLSVASAVAAARVDRGT